MCACCTLYVCKKFTQCSQLWMASCFSTSLHYIPICLPAYLAAVSLPPYTYTLYALLIGDMGPIAGID